MRSKAIAAVCAAALAIGAPAAFADKGGVSHSSKPCPGKAKGKGPKKEPPNDHGKKCGFNR